MRLLHLFEDATLPIIKMPKVFHIGTLNPNDKRAGSHEGSGLSISLNPDEWRTIGRGGVGGPLWELTNPSGQFVNAHALDKAHIGEITEWGIDHGLVVLKTTYRVSWFDDELDSEMYSDFESEQEAREEAGDEDISVIKGSITPTPNMNKVVGHAVPLALTFDILTTIYVEQNTNYAGVWWDDALDVSNYSAPRGVISKSRLGDWKIKRIDESIMERQQQRVVYMYHGTSSTHLDAIKKHGLMANPPDRTYDAESDDGLNGYETFGGVYLTDSLGKASDGADMAVDKYGGEPMLLVIQYVVGSGNMDEDTISGIIASDLATQYDFMTEHEDFDDEFPFRSYFMKQKGVILDALVGSSIEHLSRYGKPNRIFPNILRKLFEYAIMNSLDYNIEYKEIMADLRYDSVFFGLLTQAMNNFSSNMTSHDVVAQNVQVTRDIKFKGKTRIVQIIIGDEIVWDDPNSNFSLD